MVDHIAIFIENREGRILEVADVLKEKDIDLLSLSISDTKEFGILRILVKNAAIAEKVLKEAGFLAAIVGLIGVSVEDKPGGMYGFLKALADEKINIEYIYSYAVKNDGTVVFFKTDEAAKAEKILKDRGFKLL